MKIFMPFNLLVALTLFSVFLAGCGNHHPQTEENEAQNASTDPLTDINLKISLDSLNVELLNQRALLFIESQQIDNAFRDINKALTIRPDYVDLYLTLADLYLSLGQVEQGSGSLMKASELAPDDARPLVKLSQLSLILGNHDLARSFNDKALALGSFNPDAYYVRAMIFKEKGDTLSAMKNFLLAIDQNENHFEALMQTGELYAYQNNPLAESFILRTVERFPSSLKARYQLALFYQEHEQPDKALAHYDTILMADPANKFVLYNLGYMNLVYFEKPDQALQYFEEVLQADPNYLDALYNKGRSLEASGRYREARLVYQEVVRKRENYGLAIEALNRLDRLNR